MKFILIAVVITNTPVGQSTDIVHADQFPTAQKCIRAEKPWVDAYMNEIMENVADNPLPGDDQVSYEIHTFCTADNR